MKRRKNFMKRRKKKFLRRFIRTRTGLGSKVYGKAPHRYSERRLYQELSTDEKESDIACNRTKQIRFSRNMIIFL